MAAGAAPVVIQDLNLNTKLPPADSLAFQQALHNVHHGMVGPGENRTADFIAMYNRFETQYGMGPNSTFRSYVFSYDMPLLYWAVGADEWAYLLESKANFLLSKGADIHKRATADLYNFMVEQWLPVEIDTLMAAANNSSSTGVKWLLDHGADPTRLSSDDRTAVDFAIDNYNRDFTQQKLDRWSLDIIVPTILTVYELLYHPHSQETIDMAEYDRYQNRLFRPLRERILEILSVIGAPGFQNRQYAVKHAEALKKILDEPTLATTIGAVDPWKATALLREPSRKLPYNVIRHIKGTLRNKNKNVYGARRISGFKMPPTTGFSRINTGLFNARRRKSRRTRRARRT